MQPLLPERLDLSALHALPSLEGFCLSDGEYIGVPSAGTLTFLKASQVILHFGCTSVQHIS